MKISNVCVAFALSVAPLAALADGEPLDTAVFTFAADTTGAAPSVKSASGIPVSLSCPKGHVVTAVAPDGTTSELSGANGLCQWSPDVGGVWTLVDTVAGGVAFAVRYSAVGTQGDGTAGDPAKIGDAEELVDLVAESSFTNGYVFTMCGGLSVGDIVWPSGFAVVSADNGVWTLEESDGGMLYGSVPASFLADTKKSGPNRSVTDVALLPPFAYSGDGWGGSDTAAATLTFRSPDGVVANEQEFAGWGALDYRLPDGGTWTVTLTMADGSTLVSSIGYLNGFILSFR